MSIFYYLPALIASCLSSSELSRWSYLAAFVGPLQGRRYGDAAGL